MRLLRRLKNVRSVEVLRLQPGDHIVLEYDGPLTRDAIKEIRAQAEERFPDHEVSVLHRLSLKVVRREP